jgi:acyl carrier protein
MSLDREDVRNCVIESLREIVGDRTVPEIDEQTDPIRGLCLDSKDGVDMACILSEKLNYNIPDTINPLVDDERHRARRVGEITDLILQLLSTDQGGEP